MSVSALTRSSGDFIKGECCYQFSSVVRSRNRLSHNGGLSTPPIAAHQPAALPRTISRKRVLAAALLAVVAFFALDALIFRTALYRRVIEPDSSAGEFEYVLRRERHAQNDNGDNLVLTM